jgi:hypothetical protein
VARAAWLVSGLMTETPVLTDVGPGKPPSEGVCQAATSEPGPGANGNGAGISVRRQPTLEMRADTGCRQKSGLTAVGTAASFSVPYRYGFSAQTRSGQSRKTRR